MLEFLTIQLNIESIEEDMMNFREMRFSGRSVWVQCDSKSNKLLYAGYRIETVGDKYLLKTAKSEIEVYNSFAGAVNAAIELEKNNI